LERRALDVGGYGFANKQIAYSYSWRNAVGIRLWDKTQRPSILPGGMNTCFPHLFPPVIDFLLQGEDSEMDANSLTSNWNPTEKISEGIV
jgi:hypothetical protein